eukprot:Rhum_TRINITY_DN10607_c0_g1::Rhum_TRINITY_DN10607_c0_g1_i1::g.39240::m.39240
MELEAFCSRLAQSAGLSFDEVMYASEDDRVQLIESFMPDECVQRTFAQWAAHLKQIQRQQQQQIQQQQQQQQLQQQQQQHAAASASAQHLVLEGVVGKLLTVDQALTSTLADLRAAPTSPFAPDALPWTHVPAAATRAGADRGASSSAASAPPVFAQQSEETLATLRSLQAAQGLLANARAWLAGGEAAAAGDGSPAGTALVVGASPLPCLTPVTLQAPSLTDTSIPSPIMQPSLPRTPVSVAGL